MTTQERQRPLIECLNVLVEGRVRAPVEDEQFGVPDATREPVCETGRRELIVTPERDLRRGDNLHEMFLDVMSENGIRLLEELRHRLRKPAADECRQRFDVCR